MAITIVTRAGKGSPLNATEHDDNLLNIVAGIENTSTGHDHDGTDSKKVIAGNVTNTPAGNIAATDVQSALNELDTEKLAKASNLSDVADAATAFANIKQSATESATGVAELATVTETITGTDTARTTTPAGVAGAMAVQTNPKAMAQGVYMTYASSGSSGIYRGDNGNLDFGTGDITLGIRLSVPDWTPNNYVSLIARGSAAPVLYLQIENNSTGKIRANRGGSIALSSIGNTLLDNTIAEITAVFSGDTVTFYVNGIQLGDIIACTATDVTSSSNLQILSDGATREAGTVYNVYLFNRALSAAEVLDLYRNGIAYADKWGSQTSLNVSNCANTSFNTFDTASPTGFHAINNDAGTDRAGTADEIVFVLGKKYLIEFDITLTSGAYPYYMARDAIGGNNTTSQGSTQISSTHTSVIVTCTLAATGLIEFISYENTEFTISNLVVKKVGATLALESEGIQPAPGQWLDSSTNKLHAMQPASGSSLLRKKDTFEVRWTNTWAGTHEAQYIGGVNQAVLPANCYIESIIGVVSGATIEDIIIGDGSDTDRWVTITTGLSAGTTSFTLANRISDGTNYKLVVDPDANFTGSIAWTIKGIILQ